MATPTLSLTKDALVPVVSALTIAMAGYVVAYYLPALLQSVPQRLSTAKKALPLPSKESPSTTSSAEVTKSSDFPQDWWTSPSQFSLETRAILSKTWLHLTHTTAIPKSGSYKTFTIANHSLILIRGKDGQLRCFHNICRHRAYTVATKAEGCSQVLMCKYHGWTYDSTGKLIRAPKFEDVAGFDRGANGLFEVRTFVDSSGFVYVNLDVYGSDGLTIRVGVPIRAKLDLIENWSVEAPFNWKIAVPERSFRIASLAAPTGMPNLLRLLKGNFRSWRWATEFELSPLTHLIRSAKGDLWLTVSITPRSHVSSSIGCALYTSAPAGDRAQIPLSSIKSEVQSSIARLAGTFESIKADGETAVDYAQEPLLMECKAHIRLERFMGKEIHPASRLRESSQACKVADDLCRELEAETTEIGERGTVSGSLGGLEW